MARGIVARYRGRFMARGIVARYRSGSLMTHIMKKSLKVQLSHSQKVEQKSIILKE